jgi:cytochrome b6-f complex iron-sulfur subunit
VISRRDFVAFTATGCAGLVLSACTDGTSSVIHTGPLGGGDDDQTDAMPDTSTMMPDASAAACVGAATDVGLASAFMMNMPMYFSTSKFFVVRDSGGLYALTARCTHEGATCVVSGGDFYCPRHGAQFTFNGAIVSGPVISPLVHYGMCTLSGGHVGVQTSMTVSPSTRLVA